VAAATDLVIFGASGDLTHRKILPSLGHLVARDGTPVRIIGGAIYLIETRNSGAAFSVGTGATIVLTVIALAVVGVILRMAGRMRSTGWAVALGLARLSGPISIRQGETWASGRVLHPNNQYGAVAFAKPIRLMFADIVRPVREIDIVHRAGTRFVASIHYRAHIAPVFERYGYRSITRALVVGSHVVRRAQNGSLQMYLAYTFVALLIGLVLAR